MALRPFPNSVSGAPSNAKAIHSDGLLEKTDPGMPPAVQSPSCTATHPLEPSTPDCVSSKTCVPPLLTVNSRSRKSTGPVRLPSQPVNGRTCEVSAARTDDQGTIPSIKADH